MINKSKIIVASLSIFALAATALAAEFAAPGKDADPNVIISASETHKNLYAAGANVTVNGRTMGDLFAAGGMVSVIGDVEADANIAGGSLSLSGAIGGDARVVGGNISLSSPVGGDLIIGGGNISLTGKSSIGGDLIIGGGNVILEAPVKGSLKAGAGNLTINSKVEGDVAITLSGGRRSRGNLVFGPKAVVLGKITYKGPRPAVIKDGARVSSINFIPIAGTRAGRTLAKLLTFAILVKLLAWFLAGLLLVKYRKTVLQKIAQSVSEKPLENLGLGLAGLVVIPVVVILLFAVLVGYYLALVLALAYVLLLMLAALVTAVWVGAWLIKRFSKVEVFSFNWQAVLLGVVVLMLLNLIPFLGWLFGFLLFLMVLGAGLRVIKERWGEGN